MLDFLMCGETHHPKTKVVEIYPRFIIKNRLKDLMIRGGDFYAVYNEHTGMWSTDEQVAINLIDEVLDEYAQNVKHMDDERVVVSHMWDAKSGSIDAWHKFVQRQLRDNFKPLDNAITFDGDKVDREDYVSKTATYPLKKSSIDAYDTLMKTLYTPPERRKLEWAVGAVIAGDIREIQKFIVLYGSAGSGKSTFLNIIQQLFEGYYCTFDAKALGQSSNAFAMESFKNNPLVGIQHDGDLSRLEDNTKINSIVSHEPMELNEKFQSKYTIILNTFLFIGTNEPVKITGGKSGLLRRLIDVSPSGEKIPYEEYSKMMERIPFELSGIAKHCLDVYKTLGRSYYDNYVATSMLQATNDFYDFMDEYYDMFVEKDVVQLKDIWMLYKKYCTYANVHYIYNMRKVRTELMNYFDAFIQDGHFEGAHLRNYYVGFKADKFVQRDPDEQLSKINSKEKQSEDSWFVVEDATTSMLDEVLADCPAQLANKDGNPKRAWDSVKTKMKSIDPTKLHWVRPPANLITIDFDIKDETGEKSFIENLKAVSKFPKTYGELSKGGEGIHLHYWYEGDVNELSHLYDEDIEIKTYTGKSSLRRRLSKCNSLPIAMISSGLPKREVKKVISEEAIQTEKGIRSFIKNCLGKKHHGATKPEIDFIKSELDKCYENGITYDVSDMKAAVTAFATNSTNQARTCLTIVSKMKFHSDHPSEPIAAKEDDLVFFDIEVYPNLFVVVYKPEGGEPVQMVNPTPMDIAALCEHRLIGFNNRRYDNHILYAKMVMEADNYELFRISQGLINGKRDFTFREAYNLSYADVYDFSTDKKSLKKFEIELGLHHQEMEIPWDEPVDESLWNEVAGYCTNDVIATEAVFHARKADFECREILADVANLLNDETRNTPNDTTRTLMSRIMFGKEQNPQNEFVYTDLSKEFPGYKFEQGKSTYKGEVTGEGGYVYSEPGMYQNVLLLDIASMHPTTIENLNLFGPYTERFSEIKAARLAVKHKDFDTAKTMLNGALSKYLDDESQADALAYALKIAINSVYGLTAARFSNAFKDPRNIDNIVAKRGALFMIDLKEAVQAKGYKVAHIKTDSIKIPDADDEIKQFVMEFGEKYGYTFEHEATIEKMCLVNKSVYIAKYAWHEKPKKIGMWDPTGEQFAQPYVFKTLFSKEKIGFEDLCVTNTVTTAMYLDMNETLKEDEHDYHFVGKAGKFCPIQNGCGGGVLLRKKDYNYNAVGGSKGYRWLESEDVAALNKESDIDISYFDALVDDAKTSLSEHGDFNWFIS